VYLDCNATAPIDPQVRAEVWRYLTEEYGNAGSRTHQYGQAARNRVQQAREQVAGVVAAEPAEVIFTSGATEADNLALLGIAPHGDSAGHRHIISSQIEHKAVLEPLEHLSGRGFEVTLVPPTRGGWVDPEAVRAALRTDTVLVSIMHVNNETGVIQPLDEIAAVLRGHDAYFHVDAAQGFGKDLAPLRNKRIDLISVSGHKIYGPKGVGALIARRRRFAPPPLQPLMYGGGQERGLRPGTVPVPLVAGLGTAAELAIAHHDERRRRNDAYREKILAAFAPFGPVINGEEDRIIAHAVNLSIPGLDSEGVMLALKGIVAISNGSACTSQSYDPSHVLTAMGLDRDTVEGALRISWCHLTEEPDWTEFQRRLHELRR
jgi:cysteine desulfurase